MAHEDYYIQLLKEGKLEYRDGEIWRCFNGKKPIEPRRCEFINNRGYLSLTGKYNVSSHRVIWAYFNGPIPNNLEINHKDGNKLNNRIENLELVTRTENIRHSWNMGLRKAFYGEKCGSSKLTEKQVQQIKKLLTQKVYTVETIAKMFAVSPGTIFFIKNGKTWSHIGVTC